MANTEIIPTQLLKILEEMIAAKYRIERIVHPIAWFTLRIFPLCA